MLVCRRMCGSIALTDCRQLRLRLRHVDVLRQLAEHENRRTLSRFHLFDVQRSPYLLHAGECEVFRHYPHDRRRCTSELYGAAEKRVIAVEFALPDVVSNNRDRCGTALLVCSLERAPE